MMPECTDDKPDGCKWLRPSKKNLEATVVHSPKVT